MTHKPILSNLNRPSRGLSPKPHILDLPTEVLEHVAQRLAIQPEERLWAGVGSAPVEATDIASDWKEALSSFRLTCQQFARLDSAKRALFHTFYFLPSSESIHRLEAIIADQPLAMLVARVTFIQLPLSQDFDQSQCNFSRNISDKAKRTAHNRFNRSIAAVRKCLAHLPNARYGSPSQSRGFQGPIVIAKL